MQKLIMEYYGLLDTELDDRLINAMEKLGFVFTGSGYIAFEIPTPVDTNQI